MADERRRRAKRMGGVLVAALVVVLASSCTGGGTGKQVSATPSTSSSANSPTTTDPRNLARAAVEATYRAWTRDVTAANRDPAGAFGRLDDHMTGNALKTMQVYIIDRRHHGLVARGTPRFGALRITSLTGSRATAQACIDSTRFPDYRDGRLVENSAGTIRSYRLGFTLANGWKVSTFTSKEASCAA